MSPTKPRRNCRRWTGHHAWIDGMAFRGEGELLFTADSWGQLCCWSGYTAEQPEVKWKNEAGPRRLDSRSGRQPRRPAVASCGSDRLRAALVRGGRQQAAASSTHGRDVLRVLAGCRTARSSPATTAASSSTGRTTARSSAQFDASVLYTLSRLQDCGGVHAPGRRPRRQAAGGRRHSCPRTAARSPARRRCCCSTSPPASRSSKLEARRR